MAESKSFCGQKQENNPGHAAGGRKTKCCPTTTKKGESGFMNMLCTALGCCGLLSACYDPQTSQCKA